VARTQLGLGHLTALLPFEPKTVGLLQAAPPLWGSEELAGHAHDRNKRTPHGQYLLEAQQFEPLGEAAAVHAAARDLLPLINGVAKLKDPSFQDVDVGSVRELDETGETRQHVVLLPATVEVRSKVSAVLVKVGEEEPEAPTPGALDSDEWMRAALGDPHARRALALWGGRHDPMNLWKVWEIILQRSGLEIDEDQVRRFRPSINDPQIAGEEARHELPRDGLPGDVMSLAEAEAFVGALLMQWLS